MKKKTIVLSAPNIKESRFDSIISFLRVIYDNYELRPKVNLVALEMLQGIFKNSVATISIPDHSEKPKEEDFVKMINRLKQKYEVILIEEEESNIQNVTKITFAFPPNLIGFFCTQEIYDDFFEYLDNYDYQLVA